MRAASSGSLVPAMGLGDGEGAGEAARPDGVAWAGSGEGEAAADRTGVFDGWGEAAAEDTIMAGAAGEPNEGEMGVRG